MEEREPADNNKNHPTGLLYLYSRKNVWPNRLTYSSIMVFNLFANIDSFFYRTTERRWIDWNFFSGRKDEWRVQRFLICYLFQYEWAIGILTLFSGAWVYSPRWKLSGSVVRSTKKFEARSSRHWKKELSIGMWIIFME